MITAKLANQISSSMEIPHTDAMDKTIKHIENRIVFSAGSGNRMVEFNKVGITDEIINYFKKNKFKVEIITNPKLSHADKVKITW